MRMLWVTLAATLAAPVLAQAKAQPQVDAEPAPALTVSPQIDYNGFALLTENLRDYRQKRLVNLKQFNGYRAQDDTVILDTRSANAFARGHIEGAVNLPFSDFTDEKLAKFLGTDKSRRILIYCNNNFTNNINPVLLKRVPLALNIPTFINLYGYGYENIYELNGAYDMWSPAVRWTGDAAQESLLFLPAK